MTRTSLSLIVLNLLFFIPLTASAETPSTSDCERAQTHMEQARHMNMPLDREQEVTKERVRHMYQELFMCHSTTIVSKKQGLHCQLLEAEAPRQFQAMIQLVAASHQSANQLRTLAKQVQKLCPAPTTTPLTHITQLAIR
jgi:hypothetical protein